MNMKKIIVLVVITVILLCGVTANADKAVVSPERAWEMYNKSRELFTLTEVEFKEAIKERDPAEVLFASSMAKKYGKDMNEVYRLLEENKGVFETVSNLLMLEKDPALYQEYQDGKTKKERTLEEIEKDAPLLTKEEMKKLKEEYDNSRGIAKPDKKEIVLTMEEMDELKRKYDETHTVQTITEKTVKIDKADIND